MAVDFGGLERFAQLNYEAYERVVSADGDHIPFKALPDKAQAAFLRGAEAVYNACQGVPDVSENESIGIQGQ